MPRPRAAALRRGSNLADSCIHDLVARGLLDPLPYLQRHLAGDWGELGEEDQRSNQQALKQGDRLFSSYDIEAGDESRLWIITEADHSATTVLLPSDY